MPYFLALIMVALSALSGSEGLFFFSIALLAIDVLAIVIYVNNMNRNNIMEAKYNFTIATYLFLFSLVYIMYLSLVCLSKGIFNGY